MGKQGPCCHCGISTTPLWRNGPPEKPVLCNACGSRWKTKGTLLNYMPMHSGGFGANAQASADAKWPRGRKGLHKHAEHRSHKRKELCDIEQEPGQFRSDQSSSNVHEDETASRSSSWSGTCNSGGSVGRDSSSTRDVPVLGPPWDASIPSKKRSATLRLRTPVEKLARSFTSLFVDPLSSVAHNAPKFSEALFDSYNKPSLVVLDIGLDSVFVRKPPESKSEKSSFGLGSKNGTELSNVLGHSESARENSVVAQGFNGSDKGSALRGKDKAKQVLRKSEAGYLHNEENLIPNKSLLENFPYNKRDVLQSSRSPLVLLEMKDIVNFDTFTGLLTEQEQGQLMQYLSSADVARFPESLKSMFNSIQFDGALGNFQHLLLEGMFESSEPSLSPRVLQHYLQLVTVTDLTSAGWIERFTHLQNRKKHRGSVDCAKLMQSKEVDKEKLKGPTFVGAASSACSVSYGAKQLQSRPHDKADTKAWKTNSFTGKMPSTMSAGLYSTSPVQHEPNTKPNIGSSSNEAVEKEAGAKCEDTTPFLSNGPFLTAEERGPTFGEDYLDLGCMDSGEAESLLFDVPNPMSFQQAELLQRPSWTKTKPLKEEETDASQLESGALIMSNTWHTDSSPAGDWGLLWNSSCVAPAQVLPNGTVLNPGRMLM